MTRRFWQFYQFDGFHFLRARHFGIVPLHPTNAHTYFVDNPAVTDVMFPDRWLWASCVPVKSSTFPGRPTPAPWCTWSEDRKSRARCPTSPSSGTWPPSANTWNALWAYRDRGNRGNRGNRIFQRRLWTTRNAVKNCPRNRTRSNGPFWKSVWN